jgi:hypothetical protein
MMISQVISSNATAVRPTLRWSIALLVSAAIAISYLDRQIKAGLDSAFLVT